MLNITYFTNKADPFTLLALQSLVEAGKLQLLKYTPQQWPLSTPPDMYVFEGWLPEKLPTDAPAMYLMPQQSTATLELEPLTRPLPVTGIRVLQPQHPVLHAINAGRLAVTQTLSLPTLPLGMESLWTAQQEPLLSAGEIGGQRSIITCFSPSLSESLATLPQYPLLLGNAIYWCTAQTHLAIHWPHRPGDIISATSALEWRTWNGKRFTSAVTPVQHGKTQLEHIGAYRNDEIQGTSQLASRQETNIPLAATLATSAPTTKHTHSSAVIRWKNLLWLALVLLLLDSYLFHRRAVY
jgi:hypothetical protein